MKRLTFIGTAVGMLCGLAAPAWAGEMIDNPEYQQWAKFKPGSFVELKSVTETSGQKTEMTMLHTLKSVTPEKLVVETKMTMNVGGQKMEMPAEPRNVPAKIEKVEPKGEQPDAKVEKADTAEGSEDITVAGKKFATTWHSTKAKYGGVVTESKAWTSEDMPGQIVKMVTKTSGEAKSTTTMEVVKFKADLK